MQIENAPTLTINHADAGAGQTVVARGIWQVHALAQCGAIKSLSATLDDARPAARQLSESTLPAAEAAMQDLRATSKALRAVTEKIETQGAGGLIGGQKLPDYKPK